MRTSHPGPRLYSHTSIYALAFFTGAAGLIYEISWSRQIGLFFGHTVHAAAVVLCSYFAGMACGYGWAGRRARLLPRPLRGYALAEFVVAGWALAIPALVSVFSDAGLASFINSPNPVFQNLSRVSLVFVVLLPSTVGLGATWPFMAEALSPARDPSPGRVNVAYALNTAGGVVGVISGTVVLLLIVGVRQSGYLAAGISGMCGALAWVVDGRSSTAGGPAAMPIGEAADSVQDRDPAVRGEPGGARWLVLAALSGFGVLALEVLYTRLFALVFHNSSYTFGLVLAVCLLALTAGAALARRVGDALGPDRSIGDTCLLVTAAIPTSVLAFVAVTGLEYFTFGNGFIAYLAGAFGLVTLIVFPPMILAGMLLPMVWRAGWRRTGAGRVIGGLTAANTLAASSGALLASFLALPLLGLWGSFTVVAVLYLATALVTSRREAPAWTRILAGAAAVTVILGLIAPRAARGLAPGQEIMGHWDSPYGWVDVIQDEASGQTWMRRDAQHIMGSTEDLVQERRQALLPLLLHPNPARVLFTGLATGITAGAALSHPDVEDVTVVELIPEVAEAARLFARFNENLSDDPRTRVVLNDGRHFLAATDLRFDVIVADIFVPWESQTGYLYTVEHYRSARRRLMPRGLYCQWLATWQLRESELLMIADSFATVFPHVGVWFGSLKPGFVIVALIGSERPVSIDPLELAHRLDRIDSRGNAQPKPFASAEELFDLYAGEWVRNGEAVLNTDEHPRVEFLAPFAQFDEEHILVLRSRLLRALAPRLGRGDVPRRKGR